MENTYRFKVDFESIATYIPELKLEDFELATNSLLNYKIVYTKGEKVEEKPHIFSALDTIGYLAGTKIAINLFADSAALFDIDNLRVTGTHKGIPFEYKAVLIEEETVWDF